MLTPIKIAGPSANDCVLPSGNAETTDLRARPDHSHTRQTSDGEIDEIDLTTGARSPVQRGRQKKWHQATKSPCQPTRCHH